MRAGATLAALGLGALVALAVVFSHGADHASAAYVDAISAGGYHSCALTTDDTIKCWGLNTRGQVGDGTSGNQRSTAVDVLETAGGDPLGGVAAITGGGAHTCALMATDGVKCWGRNEEGQLGDGNGGDVNDLSASPVDVSGLTSGVSNVSAGAGHTCAVTDSGGIKCWGDNGSGQLGDGTFTQRVSPVDVLDSPGGQPITGIAAVSAGESHTCALTTSGGVKCWGLNSFGQLGDDTNTQRTTPVDVLDSPGGQPITNIASVSAGGLHTCARTTSSGAKCWGFNSSGQLGDDSSSDSATPVNVSGLTSTAAAITAGREHTCARTTAGAARCWGRSDQGQVGDATNQNRDVPVTVSGLGSGVAAVSAGGFHSCALLSGAGVKCWGRNVDSQVGDGTTSTKRNAPVDVVNEKPPTPTPTLTDTPTPTITPTPTDTPTPTPSPTDTPTPSPTATWTPYPTLKPTLTPEATPTANPSANGSLLIDADCEDPLGPPKDGSVTVERKVLVGSSFRVCVYATFPSPSAAGYQVRLHWTEAFLTLIPRTSTVNDVWGDQPSEEGGPPTGANASQILGPADDNDGSDAYIYLQAVDQADQPTYYQGPVAQFSFTCQSHGWAALDLRLPGVSNGSSFLSGGQPIKAALATAYVKCLNPVLDSDNDGCTNTQELGGNQVLGGRRDPMHFWDFFDASGPFGSRDKAVSGFDFFSVLARFNAERVPPPTKGQALGEALAPPAAPPAYHAGHDRRPPTMGQDAWDTGPPNGAISGLDFFLVLAQFNHSCQ